MNQHFVIWKYQAKLLLRNRQLLIGIFILLLASVFAAGYGKHFVQQQNKVIYTMDTTAKGSQLSTFKLYQEKNYPIRPTLFAGELAVYRPTSMSTLAIGQKDNYPFYHQISTNRNVYAATSTDIQNPVKLLAGNFDLSYVFLYLFPLFIIVFAFNVLAEEKENSTYTLLKIQGNAGNVILNKLAFRMTVMLVLSLNVNLLAFSMNGISWNENGTDMLAWILITMGYIVFWFALAYFIVSLRKNGAITALMLSGFWVLLLLLLPSIIHRNVARPQEAQQVQSIFNSRGDYQRASQLDSLTLVDSISKLQHPYPLVAVADTGKKAIEFKNFMMWELQYRHDINLSRKPILQQAEEYRQTISWNWINPVFAVQNAYNQVAATEINNYHHYLDSLERYQTWKRYMMNNLELAGLPFTEADLNKMPRFKYKPETVSAGKAMGLISPVLLLSLIFLVLGSLNFRKFFGNS